MGNHVKNRNDEKKSRASENMETSESQDHGAIPLIGHLEGGRNDGSNDQAGHSQANPGDIRKGKYRKCKNSTYHQDYEEYQGCQGISFHISAINTISLLKETSQYLVCIAPIAAGYAGREVAASDL
jgi:hypothetical protein